MKVRKQRFLTFLSTHNSYLPRTEFSQPHRAIQRHTQPMSFIHMPAGEDTRFLPERPNQSGVAF